MINNNAQLCEPFEFRVEAMEILDELAFCDDEIKAMYKNTNYLTGVPIMAQLIKEIRLLREQMQKGQS